MKAGVYQGGIRTLEDLRIRCRMGDDGCWLWGMGTSHGVPSVCMMIYDKNVRMKGRRAAAILAGSNIPPGYVVGSAYHCTSLTCVNPGHGVVLKRAANMKRAMARADVEPSRQTRLMNGLKQRHRLAKLDVEKVRAIRASDKTSVQLAIEYGMSRSGINKARSGRTWADVMSRQSSSVFTWRP